MTNLLYSAKHYQIKGSKEADRAKNEADRAKSYADSLHPETFVKTTGDQTIDGVKTFTSSVAAPTPAVSDNSTNIATTAWIHNNKAIIMNWGLPKKTRITLTPPSANVATEFTAPADGYFVLTVRGGSQEAYFLWNKTRAIGFHEYCTSTGGDFTHRMTCWACKGDIVDVFRRGLSAELWFVELQGA